MFFENRNTRNSTKKPGKNPEKNLEKMGEGTKKIGILLKSNHTYIYEFVANESSFGIIYS